ncbi:MAG: helix-turn-helix transcriptional regulator [Opitutales bacterium]|nr:helix-turn-helix transcriptional regulator [Opitutales bacterium]
MNQESNLLKIVGSRVRDLRKKKGYSQEAFAELCDLHRTYIGAIERGERNITLQSLEAISSALEVEPTELLQDV